MNKNKKRMMEIENEYQKIIKKINKYKLNNRLSDYCKIMNYNKI